MWYYNLCAMTYIICCNYADVAELADAPDLGSGVTDVGVQVPSSAPNRAYEIYLISSIILSQNNAKSYFACGLYSLEGTLG